MAEARARVERLLEGLLADPALRAAFRRDPVRLCVELDLPELAAALARRRRGLETLEVRESRSPLGGALAAAAAEVSAAVDFIQGAAGPAVAPEAAVPGGGGAAFPPTSGADGPRGELYRRGTFPAVRPDGVVAPAPAGAEAWPVAPTGVQAAAAAPTSAPTPVRSTLGGLAAAPGPRATLGGLAAAGASEASRSTLGSAPALGAFALAGAGPPAGLGAVAEAQTLLGTPYVWGGKSPGGFDCSGLLQYVYARVDVTIPRLAADQAAAGVPVLDQTLLAPGDVVYFDDADGQPIHHVGMYVGGRSFIHAPHEGEVVKISSLDEPAYANRLAGARRVAAGAPILAASAPVMPPVTPATLGGLAAAPAPAATGSATLGGTPVAQPSGSTLGGVPVAAAPHGIAVAIDPALLAYPGDGAPPEAVAHWMAAAAAARGLPPELPVITSLAESGLRNLPYGDRDSLGLFQQRPSQGWGTPEQVMDPSYALGLFLERAAAADAGGRFSARGLEGLGDWSQAVQRSGFPERFGEQLPRAQALLATPAPVGAPAGGARVPFAAPAPVAAAAPVEAPVGQVEGAAVGGAPAAIEGPAAGEARTD